MPETTALTDLETKASGRTPFSRADAERLLATPDLIAVGMLGEMARRAHHGDVVTYGRVCELGDETAWPASAGEAGEVRLVGRPESVQEARQLVQKARGVAGAAPLTGFSAADLARLAGGDHAALAELARALRADGLEAVAELPVDPAHSGGLAAVRAEAGAGRAYLRRR